LLPKEVEKFGDGIESFRNVMEELVTSEEIMKKSLRESLCIMPPWGMMITTTTLRHIITPPLKFRNRGRGQGLS